MHSPKLSVLACILLAVSLSVAIEHAALVEQELKGQVPPSIRSDSAAANRPISTCGHSGSIPRGHHGSVNCPFSFVVSLSQKTLIQVQGSNSSVQLSVTLVSGVSVPITVSARGMPAGAEVQFAPASAKPSFSSTMTIASSGGTPLGQFNITILAAGGGFEKSVIMSLLIVPIVHEIDIVSAFGQKTAPVGSIVAINATVANYGSLSEAFEIRAYANSTMVADEFVPKLAAEANYASRLIWNTSGFSPGIYTVLVTVPPVQGELNLLDNTREAGKTLLTQIPGSGPSPSPAAPGSVQGSNYGRQLAIVAAIAEAAIVLLVALRRRSKSTTGNASTAPGKIHRD